VRVPALTASAREQCYIPLCSTSMESRCSTRSPLDLRPAQRKRSARSPLTDGSDYESSNPAIQQSSSPQSSIPAIRQSGNPAIRQSGIPQTIKPARKSCGPRFPASTPSPSPTATHRIHVDHRRDLLQSREFISWPTKARLHRQEIDDATDIALVPYRAELDAHRVSVHWTRITDNDV
jgi:hypothetical protein